MVTTPSSATSAVSCGQGRLVILGQGYVGLAVAIRAVEAGYTVIGFDIDTKRVEHLTAGVSPVEDIPDRMIQQALTTDRYLPTTASEACADFDVAVIAVPTPLRDRSPDLSHIERAADVLSRYTRPGATVILESTTYPGTTEECLVPILERGSGLTAGRDFYVGFSPERIDPGNERWMFVNTPKVISGIDEPSCQAIKAFYDTIVEQTVVVSSPRVAELAKLLENTFRHVNIALVNELAMVANDLGINVWEAIDAASTKPFGFMRFQPGPGVGGHCLPIDPSYLSWDVRRRLGLPFRFIELANDINDHMPDYVVHRLMVALNSRSRTIRGSRVLLVGLAHKRNTRDARGAPALQIARELLALGADVRAVDPFVDTAIEPALPRVELTPEELSAAEAVVVVTDHDGFDFQAIGRHASYVLDTRNCVEGEGVEHL